MNKALQSTPVESFKEPEILQTGIAILDGKLPQTTVIIDKASLKLATDYTPKTYREEKTFMNFHSILYYISKENPLSGIYPKNPQDDPQFEAWEQGVVSWIQKQEEITGKKLINGNPPQTFDDLHIPENFPTISIESPQNDEKLKTDSFTISVNTFSKRTIARVEFYLDQSFLGRSTQAPFRLSVSIPNTIVHGFHTLKAVVYDDIDNMGSSSVRILKETEGLPASFEILDPKNGQIIENKKETFTIVLSLKDPQDFTFVHLYAQPLLEGPQELIGTVMNPNSPFLTIPWNLPESGDWILSAYAEGPGDFDLESTGLLVHISSPVSNPANTTPLVDQELIVF